jgi:peptidoglycan/LPS O-acetylase OafA/YrhL
LGDSPLWQRAASALSFSWSGVDLFFVLSGFLLGGTLMDRRRSENYFTVFYVRRILRIVPLYGLIVAIWLLSSGGADFWMYATFTQDFVWGLTGDHSPVWANVTWSLAVEEQFYLVLPLIVFLLPPRWLPQTLVGLILTAPVLRMLTVWGLDAGFSSAYELMPCRMDSLFLGVMAAWAVRQPDICRMARANPGMLRVMAGIGGAGIVVATFLKWDNTMPQIWLLGFTWIAAFFALIVFAAAIRPSALKAGPVAWIGERSYSIYLVHMPVLLTVSYCVEDGIAQRSIALGATLMLAWALYHFVEQPILSFSHAQFRYQAPARMPVCQRDAAATDMPRL